MFSFNPFRNIIESKENPFSRLHRRTLWEKIKDTFNVIAGERGVLKDEVSKNDEGNIVRPGLLDYATLHLTRMINKVTVWSWKNIFTDPIAIITIVPTSILFVITNVAHYAVAVTLTLLAIPIVSLVHVFSQLLGGNDLKKKAGKLQGIVYNEYATKNVKDNTFNSFLKATGHSYSDIIIALKKTCKEDEKVLLVMENHHKYECCITGDCGHQKGHIQFEVNLKKLQEEDKVAIKALLKLNAGNIQGNLTEQSNLAELEQLIEAPRLQ